MSGASWAGRDEGARSGPGRLRGIGARLALVAVGLAGFVVLAEGTPRTTALASATLSFGDGWPGTIVALTDRGDVVVLDASDGHEIRTLASHQPGSLHGVAAAPDGQLAYYGVVGASCGEGLIYQVRRDGGAPAEPVASGVAPAPSPDGRLLAYAADLGCRPELVVRELESQAERTWSYPDDEGHRGALYQQGAISELAWAPDSRHLAFTLDYEGCSLAVLDTAVAAALEGSEEVVVPDGGGDSRHPSWQGSSGNLALVNRAFECCYEDTYEGPPRTLLVDVAERRSKELLPSGREPSWIDFDRSGEHLLAVEDGHLSRWMQGSDPVSLAEGIIGADW